MTMKQGGFHQKRLDYLHRRHLSAIKTLAQVRRLQLPVLQFNFAEKQVNVATATDQDQCRARPSVSHSHGERRLRPGQKYLTSNNGLKGTMPWPTGKMKT